MLTHFHGILSLSLSLRVRSIGALSKDTCKFSLAGSCSLSLSLSSTDSLNTPVLPARALGQSLRRSCSTSSQMETNSMEPSNIDNLWYYASVMVPPFTASNPNSSSSSSSSQPAPPLPLSTGGNSASFFDQEHRRSQISSNSGRKGHESTWPSHIAENEKDHGRHSPKLRQLQRMFEAMDANHDGELSSGELLQWMEKVGPQVTPEGMIRMMRKVDLNTNGSLDFKEFLSFNQLIHQGGEGEDDDETKHIHPHKLQGLKEQEEEQGKKEEVKATTNGFTESQLTYSQAHIDLLIEVFQLFDKDKDGLISPQELRDTLSKLGFLKDGKNSECIDMIKHVDIDGDGQVNFSEFHHMMSQGSFDS